MRKEHDFLGDLEVPDEVYYGVQTMRAVENFNITGQKLDPDFIVALAKVKKAAALANMDTGRLRREIGDVLVQAADEIIAGGLIDQFPVDPIQGGAGTSINMNMNEVLCNRALELRGEAKGRYDIISPNNHANMAQSTNDAFPTGIKVCLSKKGDDFLAALVLIKMSNDFRLMASGPRCGLNELHLPMRQPGSSIMPGKVNPVIAEVLDQACYQVIAGDLAVTLGVENGQFELNVMEPVMAFNMFNSLNYITRAVNTFVDKLLIGLEPNVEQCQKWLDNSVGIVTALLPHIGYERSAELAKEAYTTGKPIREIILDRGILTKKELSHILSPRQMTRPGIAE